MFITYYFVQLLGSTVLIIPVAIYLLFYNYIAALRFI